MNLSIKTSPLIALVAVAWGLAGMTAAHAVDADAAQALARQNNCFKCHAVDKKKEGPSFKESAAKFKGKPDGAALIAKHLTSGEKAKFADGHEEEHKVIKAKDPADVKNLADWILAQ
jgi:cytochrome c